MAPLVAKKKVNQLNDLEKYKLEVYANILDEVIESDTNEYDSACVKYLDSKADKKGFEKFFCTR